MKESELTCAYQLTASWPPNIPYLRCKMHNQVMRFPPHPPSAPILLPSLTKVPQSLHSSNLHLKQCNTLDLHIHPLRQLMHRHTTPRRLVAEPLLILGVHLRKIPHVHQEHIHFHHLSNRRSPFFQDRFKILDARTRLVGYAAGYQGAAGVGGDLSAAIDLRGGADGLGLWGRGKLVGMRRGGEKLGVYVGSSRYG